MQEIMDYAYSRLLTSTVPKQIPSSGLVETAVCLGLLVIFFLIIMQLFSQHPDAQYNRLLTSWDFLPDGKLCGRNRDEIETAVLHEAMKALVQNGLDAQITGVRIYGPRMREALFQETSELDIALAYEGHAREEEVFQATKGWKAAGMRLSISPVRESEGRDLEGFLEKAETSLDRKEEQLKAREEELKEIYTLPAPPGM